MQKKLGISLLFLVFTLLTTAHCGRFDPALESRPYQGLSVVETNYRQTVFQVFRSQCATCHAQAQQPLFAAADLQDSFAVVQRSRLIDPENPSESKVVTTIRGGGHHGVKDFVADNLLAEITDFAYHLGRKSSQ